MENIKKVLLYIVMISCSFMSYAAFEAEQYRGMGQTTTKMPSFQQLLKQGYISSKPTVSRYDYNDIYILKKPLKFMGQTLIAVSDEYMSEYVGCCVSEGWGAIFKKETDTRALQQFSQQNQCHLSTWSADSTTYYKAKLPRVAHGQYLELSCRERDLSDLDK